MKRFMPILFVVILAGCVHTGTSSKISEGQLEEYSSTAVTVSDFSMKIMAYYQAQKLSIPDDFDAKRFFDVLEARYPDQSRVKHVKESYKVSARPLDGGFYSVMLCDPNTDGKIMEDLSCHISRVEIRSWEDGIDGPCTFEDNWKSYCQ